MKKLLAVMALILMLAGSAAARDRVTRDTQALPAEAQSILKKYYAKVPVNHIKIESKTFGGNSYDVVLNNGTELDFDSKGNLEEIDCGMNAVPSGLLLKSIRDYVSKNFDGKKIVSLDIKSHGYEIELSDGTDLEFDRSGAFKKIDI